MPISASKSVFAVLAVGAGSVLGYNWMTTGCPSGVCPTERAAANVIPAAMTAETEATSCSTEKADSCCPLTDAATVTTVANTAEGCEAACEDKAACDDMTACDSESACSDKAECQTDAANVQAVSMTTEAQSECADKPASCCPLTEATEQTASNAP